jgi:hypothetical protein
VRNYGRCSAAAPNIPNISPIPVAETAASTPSEHLTIATKARGRNEALLRRFAGVMGPVESFVKSSHVSMLARPARTRA